MPDFSVLPDQIVKALKDGGYETPEQVLEAGERKLWAVKGVSRKAAAGIIGALREPLDVALDPFIPVAMEFANTFKRDYPDSSIVLNINEQVLTVGDFRNLAEALKTK